MTDVEIVDRIVSLSAEAAKNKKYFVASVLYALGASILDGTLPELSDMVGKRAEAKSKGVWEGPPTLWVSGLSESPN